MIDRFDRVSGEIYRGGAPSDSDLELLSDVFNMKTILSLDGSIASNISSKVKELGMRHIVIPISGSDSFSLMKYLQNHIVSILNRHQPIYVHCRHGSDRTGMAIALYRTDHDGWSVDKALSEAETYGFGNKLDNNTEALYRKIITKEAQSSVDQMRDHFDMGRVPPASSFSLQQSFAPEVPIENTPIEDTPPAFRDPNAFNLKMQHPASEKEKRVRKLRALLLEELAANMAPQVGQYDNFEGIRGAGPLAGDDENTGGFSYDEGGGLPGGVGPSGTGGSSNL
ncbi:hypothetical protein LCGC14_0390130 [marine sediment metagenome]|uniref:Tyrosine specific protein phosphatases domain-containing protein n=1 Tax=marine sediment metagenome TaxID=412755 RepID=A0A0F9VLX9_9ZZZZ